MLFFFINLQNFQFVFPNAFSSPGEAAQLDGRWTPTKWVFKNQRNFFTIHPQYCTDRINFVLATLLCTNSGWSWFYFMGIESDSHLFGRKMPTLLTFYVSEMYKIEGHNPSKIIPRLIRIVCSHFGYCKLGIFFIFSKDYGSS